MDTTPSPRPNRPTVRSALRRGLGAAGAAVVVAFVGTAGLGAGQAQAAGVSEGHLYAGSSAPRQHHHRVPATHPANIPPATALAVRYSFDNGELIEL